MNPERIRTDVMTDLNGTRFVTNAGAERILREHGFTSDTPATLIDGDDCTFNNEVGIRHQYKLSAVLNWLGY